MSEAAPTDDLSFRDQVRSFVQAHLPQDVRDKVFAHQRLAKDDYVRWQKALYKRGWAGFNWPKEFGGTGWTRKQQHIFLEECGILGAPRLVSFGLIMVAHVIMQFGNEFQKHRYLPSILSSDEWWCQGYSEPDAGSDLASLKTRAVIDGEHYVVNGQKTWTTLAQYADMMFCLVRTNVTERKQDGISFLLIDMRSPGITVRPIITLDEEHEINEVFFDDVRVPVENRVGDEGRGWTYAKYLLGLERTSIARVGESKRELQFLKTIARDPHLNRRGPKEDNALLERIAKVEIELIALDLTVARVLASRDEPGVEASLLKIKGAEIQQRLSELAMDAVDIYALPFVPEAMERGGVDRAIGPSVAAPLAARFFNNRKVSIYGGSDEIQKNIIANLSLGL